MSDTSQSIFRASLLALVIAVFVAVWTADSRQPGALSIARRNQLLVPAHALKRSSDAQALAARRGTRSGSTVGTSTKAARGAAHSPARAFDKLAAGSYRVVYADGRVEWLTVVSRDGQDDAARETGLVLKTSLGGQDVHLIRVSREAGASDVLR